MSELIIPSDFKPCQVRQSPNSAYLVSLRLKLCTKKTNEYPNMLALSQDLIWYLVLAMIIVKNVEYCKV